MRPHIYLPVEKRPGEVEWVVSKLDWLPGSAYGPAAELFLFARAQGFETNKAGGALPGVIAAPS